MASNLPPSAPVKVWWKSKTVWFNTAMLILFVLLYVLDGITAGEVQLPGGIDPEWIIFLQGVVNLILRFASTKALIGRRG
jgi:hypothetical protein